MNKDCWDCQGKHANTLPCLDCLGRDIEDCRCKKGVEYVEACYGGGGSGELRQVVEKYKEFKWLRGREMSDEDKSHFMGSNNVNSYGKSG